MVKRRSFLGYFGIGWLTTCFPVVLAACAPSKSTDPATKPPADSQAVQPVAVTTATDSFRAIGSVADLEKSGYLQTKEVSLTRDPANPQQLIAVNPTCTHQGCIVKWMPGEKKYNCPCHDAGFAADGKVLKGPAKQSLATYPAKIVGTQVLVKI